MKVFVRRVKGILAAVSYIIVFYLVSIFVNNIYVMWQKSITGISLAEVAQKAVNNSSTLGIISYVLCFWVYLAVSSFRKVSFEDLIENKKNAPIIEIMAVCFSIGARLLVSVYHALAQNIGFLRESIEKANEIVPEPTTNVQIIIMIFATVIIAPLFEEMLFRGLVMGELMRVMRQWAAIVLQGVLFGAVHGVLFQSIFAAFIGIALGVIYYKTKSIKVVAVCHGAFNLSAVLAQNVPGASEAIILAVLGIALVTCSLCYIIKSNK